MQTPVKARPTGPIGPPPAPKKEQAKTLKVSGALHLLLVTLSNRSQGVSDVLQGNRGITRPLGGGLGTKSCGVVSCIVPSDEYIQGLSTLGVDDDTWSSEVSEASIDESEEITPRPQFEDHRENTPTQEERVLTPKQRKRRPRRPRLGPVIGLGICVPSVKDLLRDWKRKKKAPQFRIKKPAVSDVDYFNDKAERQLGEAVRENSFTRALRRLDPNWTAIRASNSGRILDKRLELLFEYKPEGSVNIPLDEHLETKGVDRKARRETWDPARGLAALDVASVDERDCDYGRRETDWWRGYRDGVWNEFEDSFSASNADKSFC